MVQFRQNGEETHFVFVNHGYSMFSTALKYIAGDREAGMCTVR